ncbi:MAG: DedA family protein [Clostridia bacterium]|nr:DedA family protein [Clostridia bacterium]
MFEFIESILKVIIEIINSLGYWGIGGGMLIESACIPLPSEVVLPLAGNMVASGKLTLLGANIAVAVGSMIGSFLAYAVGYWGGRPFILKYGKYFFVSEEHFYLAEKTFNKYGVAAVFFGRLLPVIRTFISLPAGIAKMDIKKFTIYSLIGMIPWNFMLIYLGYAFGQRYETVIRPIFKKFEYGVIGIIVLIILAFCFKFFFKKKKTAHNK